MVLLARSTTSRVPAWLFLPSGGLWGRVRTIAIPRHILCHAKPCSLSRNCLANYLSVETWLRKLSNRCSVIEAGGLAGGVLDEPRASAHKS